MEKWETVRDLLGSERVADEVDVHVENKAGNTCLVLIMLARSVFIVIILWDSLVNSQPH